MLLEPAGTIIIPIFILFPWKGLKYWRTPLFNFNWTGNKNNLFYTFFFISDVWTILLPNFVYATSLDFSVKEIVITLSDLIPSFTPTLLKLWPWVCWNSLKACSYQRHQSLNGWFQNMMLHRRYAMCSMSCVLMYGGRSVISMEVPWNKIILFVFSKTAASLQLAVAFLCWPLGSPCTRSLYTVAAKFTLAGVHSTADWLRVSAWARFPYRVSCPTQQKPVGTLCGGSLHWPIIDKCNTSFRHLITQYG